MDLKVPALQLHLCLFAFEKLFCWRSPQHHQSLVRGLFPFCVCVCVCVSIRASEGGGRGEGGARINANKTKKLLMRSTSHKFQQNSLTILTHGRDFTGYFCIFFSLGQTMWRYRLFPPSSIHTFCWWERGKTGLLHAWYNSGVKVDRAIINFDISGFAVDPSNCVLHPFSIITILHFPPFIDS